MRELEMRMRVFRFLKARLRNTIMPATVGIGLAVGGCSKEGLTSTNDASLVKDAGSDSGGVPIYSAILPTDGPSPDQAIMPDLANDSAFDGLGRDTPIYGTPDVPRDVNVAIDQSAAVDSSSGDSGRDLGMITKYLAPIPDASADKAIIAPLYAAIVPSDARDDTGLVAPRYGAQPPNAS